MEEHGKITAPLMQNIGAPNAYIIFGGDTPQPTSSPVGCRNVFGLKYFTA
jgi:hypothetical protein